MPPRSVKGRIASASTKTKGKGKRKSLNSPSPEPPSLPAICAESQSWDCEDGPLPSEEGEEGTENNPASSSQAKNASSPHWAPWQDRLLAQQAIILQPFLKPPRQIKVAWETLAETLLEESTKLGPHSIIERSGDSCRSRFERLVKYQREAETRAKQATGTDEEVNDHIKMMTDIVMLIDDQKSEKKNSAKEKQKADVENQAASELRTASTAGLVHRQTLTDVSQLPGATLREKQGQRPPKRKRSEPSSQTSKENQSQGPGQLKELIVARLEDDQAKLAEITALDQQRHNELIEQGNQLASTVGQLADAVHAQAEELRLQRVQEQEFRAIEADRNRLLNTLLMKFIEKQDKWY